MTKNPRRAFWWSVRTVIASAIAVLTVGGVPFAAQAQAPSQSSRLDTYLRRVADSKGRSPQRVIIRVRPGARADVRRSLTAHRDTLVAEHESIDALTAIVHGDDLSVLAERSDVLSVSTDAEISAHGQTGGLLGGVSGLLGGVDGTLSDVDGITETLDGEVNILTGTLDPATSTNGSAVPPRVLRDTLGLSSSLTGSGIGVAVIDSGLEMSSEFKGRVTAFYDFTNGKTLSTSPSDGYGHGTHVSGIIGGSGALSFNREYRGLAPSVRIIGLKVLDSTGAGLTSDVIRAIDFVVANRTKYGIHIVNLSLGHPIYEPAGSDPLVQAVERATQAGLVVVAAAGNLGKNPETGLRGYAGITSPGNAPSAITAGAVATIDTVARSDDRIPEYSSAGPTWYDAIFKPDVVAPGHNIVAVGAKQSTLYKNYPQLRAADADYMRLSGTSMATAVTSGVVALMLQAHHDVADDDAAPLTPNTVKAVLQYTAFVVKNDLGLEYDRLMEGAGGLNGKGAIEVARSIDTRAAQGTPWLTSTPSPYTVIGGETNTWTQTVIWGSAVIWGSTVDVNQTAWGSAVIWGSGVTWGSAVIWGSNVVWDDPETWGSAVIWGSSTIGTSNGLAVIWGSTTGMTAENTTFQTRDPGSTAGMTYGASAAIVLPKKSAQKTTGPRRSTTATMTKKPTTSSANP